MAERSDMTRRRGPKWPWGEMELMLEHMFSSPKVYTRPTWRPAVDVFEREREFIIVVDVPGLDADQVDVQLQGRRLIVSGERPPTEKPGQSICHVMERSQGAFERRIHLPTPVDAERIEAKCRNGVLTIRIPKPGR